MMTKFFDSCLRAAKEKIVTTKQKKKIIEEIREVKNQMFLEFKDGNLSEEDYKRLNMEFNYLMEE